MGLQVDRVAKLAFAPYLIYLGLKIRKHALILPEAAGSRSGAIGNGPLLRVLIVGDSSAAGVGVDTQEDALAGQVTTQLAKDHRVEWTLIAQTGATTKSTLHTLNSTSPEHFDVALVALGVNDVTRGVSQNRFLERQKRLRVMLRSKFGVSRIVVTAVPPMDRFPALTPLLQWILGAQADRFRTALKDALHSEPDCRHLEMDFPMDPELMASDGFHPSAKTYAIWGDAAAKLMVD